MGKILYPKARIALYLSLAAILVMIINLFAISKTMLVIGLVLSFLLSIFAVLSGIIYLKFIYKNEEKFRGDSMCWIAISLGTIALLSNLPFIITLFYAI